MRDLPWERDYTMTLNIYPTVTDEGYDIKDVIGVSIVENNVELLKSRTNGLILDALSSRKDFEGKCYVEMNIDVGDDFYDHDECWCYVSVNTKEILFREDSYV